MLIGSGFSSAFADVILLIDAVMILLVAIVLFPDRIAAVVHRLATLLASLIAHIGVRH